MTLLSATKLIITLVLKRLNTIFRLSQSDRGRRDHLGLNPCNRVTNKPNKFVLYVQ